MEENGFAEDHCGIVFFFHQENNMEVVKGYVEHTIYRNAENGYTVFTLVSDGCELTCVGICQELSDGETIEVSGEYKEHSLYGLQLSVQNVTVIPPEDLASIERYLGSGAIKGIGKAIAARIVRKFKTDTLRILDEEPERLAEIRGISKRTAKEIGEVIREKRELREEMMFLQELGIGNTLSMKIHEVYGPGLYSILKDNPYKLAEDIPGVGFKIADDIAEKVGIVKDSDFRIRCGLQYVLVNATRDGHLYLPKERLFVQTADLLGFPSVEERAEQIEKNLDDLIMERKAIGYRKGEEVCIYDAGLAQKEIQVARMLQELNFKENTEETMISRIVSQLEKEADTVLDELQRRCVYEAASNGLLVITGNPGTGKTTTINMLIRYFDSEGKTIRLAAPTGRAAKRMTETTGMEASTIHRLLEVGGMEEEEGGKTFFGRNRRNPLEADVIIVDEVSMVDLLLMFSLLQAIRTGTRLILVGDVDQLPSVGPGNVLRDVIESGCFPVVKLTHIFRQAQQSDIIVNASKINAGEHFPLDNKSRDFFFLKREDPTLILRVVLSLVMEKMPKYVQADVFDIQVLTPMRKGVLGVERLNQVLQQFLNPPSPEKKEKESGEMLFRTGDKVMQIKNNYQLQWEIRGKYGIAIETGEGVFNGDMGIIRSIDPAREQMIIEFEDGHRVEYPFSLLEELELAYAITIHKAQGSEYPAVVIPMFAGPKMLLNRNLLYTAITRAKKCVTLVGSENVFHQMIDQNESQIRYTSLKERIRELHGIRP